MAHFVTASRVASSALTSLRLGASKNLWIPVTTNLVSNHEDLCKNFKKLNLSPLEAQLTVGVQSASNKSLLSHLERKEYRLPSVIKPVSITVPSLYNGAILEKEVPPTSIMPELIDPFTGNAVQEAPSSQEVTEKQASRLVVIRRRKIKKHKLKKLRKKMKFVWLKSIQRKEYKKEKNFQAEQMAIVREAEAFDAAKYVEDILRQSKTKRPQRYFRGSRLPPPIIEELKEKTRIKRVKEEEHKLAIQEMKQEIMKKGLLKRD